FAARSLVAISTSLSWKVLKKVLGIHSSWAFGVPFTEPHRYLKRCAIITAKSAEIRLQSVLIVKKQKKIPPRAS
ncbi:MAG: hypothetical protein OQL27_12905, partial [Sedimenticola sp.]|nr:hypothetical protein [Sedimenticola sp.]